MGHLVQGELYSRPRAENSLPSDQILYQSRPVNPLIEDMHPENSTLFSIQTTRELTEGAIEEARGQLLPCHPFRLFLESLKKIGSEPVGLFCAANKAEYQKFDTEMAVEDLGAALKQHVVDKQVVLIMAPPEQELDAKMHAMPRDILKLLEEDPRNRLMS